MSAQNYSVIAGKLPNNVDTSIEYLQHLSNTFPGAKRIYVVMTETQLISKDASSEVLASLIDSLQIQIILSRNSIWDGINRAVATSDTEHIVILEREMWPAYGIEQAWFREAQQSGVSLVYFEKRQAYDDVASHLIAGSYARSTPELDFLSSNAFAVDRKIFLDLRGYDERTPYGDYSDIDLRVRFKRARINMTQLKGPDSVAYFPAPARQASTNLEMELSSEKAWLAKVNMDKSIYRNLVDWSVPVDERTPLVSVAIATKDRGPMLADSLHSVLYQTFQDFEVIVVDDGSSDDSAQRVVEQINDNRIRYIYQKPAGISAARNRAADEAISPYTAVHDDDDIMLPERLEVGLNSITSPFQATFGGWVNFGDGNGQMQEFYGKLVFDSKVNAHNGQGPGHATWTVPTKLIQQFRYDERLSASVDHNLATRMEIAGVEWVHSGHFMYLRRVHDSQVTALDSGGQKVGHVLSRYLSNVSTSPAQLDELRAAGKATTYPRISNVSERLSAFRAYLPDKLVNRRVKIVGNTQNLQFDADVPDKMALLIEDRDILNNRNMYECAILDNILLRDIATFRRRGLTKYSWQVELTGIVPNEDQDETIFAASELDIELYGIELSEGRVRKALKERVSSVTELLLSKSSEPSLLVIENDEPYSNWVETELSRDALQARRILAAGEFGTRSATRMYLYQSASMGMRVLARITDLDKAASATLVTR